MHYRWTLDHLDDLKTKILLIRIQNEKEPHYTETVPFYIANTKF